MGDYDMHNGRVRHIEGNIYCIEKYYKEYPNLLKDSKRFLAEFESAGFFQLKSREYIMDHKMSEKEFRLKFVDIPQLSDPPGFRYMIRVVVEQRKLLR